MEFWRKTFMPKKSPLGKKRQGNALYIGEGKIEKRFLEFLNQSDFIQLGRFKEYRLMQDKLSMSDSLLARKRSKIFCILDTDCVEASNFSTLIHNVKMLKGICDGRVFLLIQNKNFEDELSYILDCKNLCEQFNLPHKTHKDLKTYLSQSVNYEKLISKHNLLRYCCRPDIFRVALENNNQKIDDASIILFEYCMQK